MRCGETITHVSSRSEAVDEHPHVADIEAADHALQGDLRAGCGVQNGRAGRQPGEGGGDVRPGGNDGRTNHERKGDEGEAGDVSAEPEDLAVGNQDDREVLEDAAGQWGLRFSNGDAYV